MAAADELLCVACNKRFKNVQQWRNHEQSKKHRRWCDGCAASSRRRKR